MFNKVVLVGNLTRDIELRYSQGGMAIAKSAIATSRKFSTNGEKREEVMFIDITFFGRSGEIANQYLRKGSKILVEGRLNFEQWSDQNGQKRSKHSVTVENMQMLDSKGDAPMQQNSGGAINRDPSTQSSSYGTPDNSSGYGANSSYNQYDNSNYQNNQPTAQPTSSPQQPSAMPEIDIDDDDIPF